MGALDAYQVSCSSPGPIDFIKTKLQCIHLWDLSISRKLNLVTMVSSQRLSEWLSDIVTNLLLLGGTLPSPQVTQPRAKEPTWVLPWDNPGRNLFPSPTRRHTTLRPSSLCFLPSWNSAWPQTRHLCPLCDAVCYPGWRADGREAGSRVEAPQVTLQSSRGLPLIRDRPEPG